MITGMRALGCRLQLYGQAIGAKWPVTPVFIKEDHKLILLAMHHRPVTLYTELTWFAGIAAQVVMLVAL